MGQSNSSPDDQYSDQSVVPNGSKSSSTSSVVHSTTATRPAVIASQLANSAFPIQGSPAPVTSSLPPSQLFSHYSPDPPLSSFSPYDPNVSPEVSNVSNSANTYFDPSIASLNDYSAQAPQSLSGLVRGLVDHETLNDSSDSSTLNNGQFPNYGVPALYLAPQKIETVPTAFKWVHGGQEVFVTGSFNNWQGKILMYRNEDGEFSLIIDIPPGTHHYKYIVDQEWMLDEDANTIEVNGVVNNVVEVKRPVFEYVSVYADSDDEGDQDDRKQKTDYGQRAPLSSDYVNEPPKLPPHLTEILLNQTQPTDPQMLPVPQHVILNHLYILSSADPSLFVTGITQRFKPNSHTSKITHKFVTTVFYAPKPKNSSQMALAPGGSTQYPLSEFSSPSSSHVDPSHQVQQAYLHSQPAALQPKF
jgi:hypothetical protein